MNPEERRRLEDLLNREVAAAQSLVQILAAERAALTADSPQAVQETAAEKVRLLASIEEMEAERRALWNAEADAGLGEAGARWRSLLELMARCRIANDVNGYIIHIRQNQLRQLLDIVRGAAPVTYGPQGKTFARTPRALAQA